MLPEPPVNEGEINFINIENTADCTLVNGVFILITPAQLKVLVQKHRNEARAEVLNELSIIGTKP